MMDFNAFIKNREELKEDESIGSEILDNELIDCHQVGDKM